MSAFLLRRETVTQGNVQVFKYFITECNCNAAYPGPLGLTPLHLASEQGHLDVVKYLVTEQQIEPFCEDAFGNTPLHRACASGCQAVAEFLTSESDKYLPITKLTEKEENKKTEKLATKNCRAQSFNRIQQTAPHVFSLAVYV